jgi:hypothetical protein
VSSGGCSQKNCSAFRNKFAVINAPRAIFGSLRTGAAERAPSTSGMKLDTIVNLTGGVHIEIYHNALLGVAVGTPVSGPKPYQTEVLANFNFRW